jgi:hypothetical protein
MGHPSNNSHPKKYLRFIRFNISNRCIIMDSQGQFHFLKSWRWFKMSLQQNPLDKKTQHSSNLCIRWCISSVKKKNHIREKESKETTKFLGALQEGLDRTGQAPRRNPTLLEIRPGHLLRSQEQIDLLDARQFGQILGGYRCSRSIWEGFLARRDLD